MRRESTNVSGRRLSIAPAAAVRRVHRRARPRHHRESFAELLSCAAMSELVGFEIVVLELLETNRKTVRGGQDRHTNLE